MILSGKAQYRKYGGDGLPPAGFLSHSLIRSSFDLQEPANMSGLLFFGFFSTLLI